MSNKLRGWLRLLSIWLPAFLGVWMIALESTVMMGAAETSGPLRKLWESLFGAVSEARWDLLHHYIRKTGHFSGYGLVGGLFFRAWYLSMPLQARISRMLRAVIYALLCTLILASSDEYHQSFLPGRTSSPYDVLIDMSGALTIQVILWIVLSVFSRKQAVAVGEELPELIAHR
jgi:VanZ family protein